jgi:hypothetical protein
MMVGQVPPYGDTQFDRTFYQSKEPGHEKLIHHNRGLLAFFLLCGLLRTAPRAMVKRSFECYLNTWPRLGTGTGYCTGLAREW